MIFHDIQQNTPEWDSLRGGKITASMFVKLFMAKSTKGYDDVISDTTHFLKTGEKPESFSSEWMDRGHEVEPIARKHYELKNFIKVKNGGFYELNEWVGCSPDGLVGDDGLIEIKCPKHNTIQKYLETEKLPKIYEKQVHGQLWITGKKWCDFMAYHPKYKPLIIRVFPDKEMFTQIELKVNEAIELVKKRLEILK